MTGKEQELTKALLELEKECTKAYWINHDLLNKIEKDIKRLKL